MVKKMLKIKGFKHEGVLILLLSILTAISFPYMLPVSDISIIKSSFIWILIVIPIFFWYRFSIRKVERKDFLFCVFPAILFSVFLKTGRDLSIYGELSYGFLSLLKNLVAITGIFILIYSLLISLLKFKPLKTKRYLLNRQYNFLFLFIVFLIAWLPILLIFWPGIYTYDSAMQIYQLLNNSITEHHPVIHTLLLNMIILVGKLTGSYYIGTIVQTVFQMLICLSVNAYICSRLSSFKINKLLYFSIIVYYALFPLNMLTPIYITKDTLFSTFFFLLIFKFCEYYTLEKKELSKNKAIELIIIIVLVGLFRNNAIYALLATIPFLLFIKNKKVRSNLIFIFALSSFFTLVTDQVLVVITKAQPGMQGQMYSVPLQQLARSYNNNQNSFTLNEKKELFNYVPEKNIKNYNPRISDYVKGPFTLKKSGNSTGDFIKLWCKVGIKNKKNYTDAFLMMTQGYWDPNFQFPDNYYKIPIVEVNSRESEIYGEFDKSSRFPKTRQKIINAFYKNHFYKNFSILSLLFSPGFTVWMYIILFLYSKHKNLRSSYFIYIFLSMYYGTLILGPVALVRYIYPFMLSFPIMLVFVLDRTKSQNKL